MSKLKLPIRDSLFAHNSISSFWNESDYIEWDRGDIKKDYVFLTDSDVHTVDSFHGKKKYAWLLESPDVTPEAYKFVLNNHTKFDKIFTFDIYMLSNFENALFLPFGGSMLDKSDIKIHDKSKNVSMMLSWKRNLDGHKLRHAIYRSYQGAIDFYGSGVNGVNEKKIVSTKDYRFSISIENCKKDYYFTEKIIDCFLSGTIPVYWGCPSVGDFFDSKGIITFDSMDELNDIIPTLNEELYNSMSESIINNFNISKKYMIAEDYLFNNYTKLII